MTSQYTEARKRVEEAIARYATPGVASSGVVCCPDDLRLILALSAPPVTVEDVARAACDGWSNGNIQYDDCPAHHQDSWLEAGRAVLALFHTEGKT
jgi:hypothetical protein